MNIQECDSRIKDIDTRIDTLLSKYETIKKNRDKHIFDQRIYKCNDTEATTMIKIDKEINILEKERDWLLIKRREQYRNDMKSSCLLAHKNFIENKFEARIFGNKNENYKKIYFNDMDLYNKLIAASKKSKEKLIILEYIDMNNRISHESNMPILKTVYSYNPFPKKIERSAYLVSEPLEGIPKETFYINNDCYSEFYKKSILIENPDIYEEIIYFYDKDNNELGSYVHNFYGSDIITFHNKYSSQKFISIQRINKKDYYKDVNTVYHYHMEYLDIDDENLINKILKKLSKNKKYKYDIKKLEDLIYN